MITDNFKDKNIDWLIYDKAFMRAPIESPIPRIWVYFKLLINIFSSFLRKKPSGTYKGGLFYIDNSRHFEQAKLLIPNVRNALYHNNTNKIIKGGKQINISDGIYSNYKKLLKYYIFFLNEEISGKSKVFKMDLPVIINGILLYEHYIDFFRKNKINFVLIFTDHSYKNRALLFAAQQSDIPTIYIPHASVSEIFPPLEMDVAFLEGEDMKIKYKKASEKWNYDSRTKIILSGNYKTNFYRNLRDCNSKTDQLAIGLAFNGLDSRDKLEQLIESLVSNSLFNNYMIIIRPHPNIKEHIINSQERVKISNSNAEDPVEFFNKISFLISGDSNIILEAALLKKYIFFMNLSITFEDLYDFKKNKICPFINNIEELEPYLLENFQNYILNTPMLSYYDSSFNKNYDGVKTISNYLNGLINS